MACIASIGCTVVIKKDNNYIVLLMHSQIVCALKKVDIPLIIAGALLY